jgi:tetratricopeptide (TPR) repeat protein
MRPDYANALDSRALIYLKLDELARALADYDAALRLDPGKAHSLYGRGLAKRKLGDLAGAEADLTAATSLVPRVAEEYSTYGLQP